MVFSKVGGAGLFAIASISFSSRTMAASRAGAKSATTTLSKGGTPSKGPVQGASRGAPSAAKAGSGRVAAPSAALETARNMRRSMKSPMFAKGLGGP